MEKECLKVMTTQQLLLAMCSTQVVYTYSHRHNVFKNNWRLKQSSIVNQNMGSFKLYDHNLKKPDIVNDIW